MTCTGSVASSPDGKQLASGVDQTVQVWDAATGHETLTLKGHPGDVTSVAFSPDGSRIASASSDAVEFNHDGSLDPSTRTAMRRRAKCGTWRPAVRRSPSRGIPAL